MVAITDDIGSITSQQRFLPFGGERTDVGEISETDYGFTGQRNLDEGMGGLMDYKARFYSPYITRWTQPDTIVPDPLNPQAWNRYSYALNNPIRYNDPSGHKPCDERFGCNLDPLPLPVSQPHEIPYEHPHGNLASSIVINNGFALTNYSTDPKAEDPSSVMNYPACNPDTVKCFYFAQISGGSPGQFEWQEVPCSFQKGTGGVGSHFYNYEGSIIPIAGLAVDAGGMIVDGASILFMLGFGIPGILVGGLAEFVMASVEFGYVLGMELTGSYEALYDYGSSYMDSKAAQFADSQKAVPLVGFSYSLLSAANNLQIISSGIEEHPAYLYSWDGSPPTIP